MKRIAPFLVLLAGILWGMIGIFVRQLNEIGFTSMDIVAIRAIVTSVLLLIFLLIFDRKMLVIKPKDIWCFVGTGVVSIVFFNFCYFKAINMTSLSVAAVLLYTAPAIVMVVSAVLFKEKITVIKVISIILTFVGCVLVAGVIGANGNLTFGGILFGLGAGFGYAMYSIFSRFAIKRGYHSLTISFYTFVFATIGSVFLADMKSIVSVSIADYKVILFCIIFGLVSTVIPYIVYTLGLKEMENSQASIIASIEPVAATILGVTFFKEHLQLNEIVGAILVIGAIIISNINMGKKNEKD